jgi:hypothetical protein
MLSKVNSLQVVGGEEAVLCDGTNDGNVSLAEMFTEPLKSPRAEVGAHRTNS